LPDRPTAIAGFEAIGHHRLELCRTLQHSSTLAVRQVSSRSAPKIDRRIVGRSKNDLPGRGMSECRNVVVGRRRKMDAGAAMICSCRVLRADMKARGIPRVFWQRVVCCELELHLLGF